MIRNGINTTKIRHDSRPYKIDNTPVTILIATFFLNSPMTPKIKIINGETTKRDIDAIRNATNSSSPKY